MTRPRRLLFALLSLLFPGAAQGFAGRRGRTIVALAGSVGLVLGLLLTPLLVLPFLAFRVAVAVDGYFIHRDVPRVNRPLGVLALVLCAVSSGFLVTTFGSYRIPASSMMPTLEIGDSVLINQLVLRWRGPERGEVIVFRFPCEPRNHYIKRVIGIPGDTIERRCDRTFVNGRAIPRALAAAGETAIDTFDGMHEELTADRFRETHGSHTYFTYQDPADGSSVFDEWPRDPAEVPRCGEQYRTAEQVPIGTIEPSTGTSDGCALQLHYTVPRGTYFVLGDYRDNSNDSRGWGVVPADNVTGVLVGVFWPLSRAGNVE